MSDSGQLQHLFEAQQLDLKLDALRDQEGQISEELRGVRQQQDTINNRLEDQEIELERVERQIRQLELDLATSQEQQARNKAEQERNATNAKLQSQYENVIQQLAERVTDYQESLAPLYDRQKALREASQAARSEHKALRPELSRLEDEDEARLVALRAQGEQLRADRSALASQIEPRLLKEYDQIRKGKKGVGIVSYSAGRCMGCNVQLPVNIQQRAASGQLPPVKCPSCGRFLYKPE